MEFGAHHRTKRLVEKSPFNAGIVRSVDAMTYAASFVSLTFAVHQVWLIWSAQNATGVSIVLWSGFLIGHIVWSIYGFVHREKVLMVVHSLWVLFCAVIVVGVVAFS